MATDQTQTPSTMQTPSDAMNAQAISGPSVPQLLDSYGSGSAVRPFAIGGATEPTSAPVMTATHRGEGAVAVPQLHYGSDGSGSSFLSPTRHRSPKRPASSPGGDEEMDGGQERPAVRNRGQTPADPGTTLEQRLAHLELLVGSLDACQNGLTTRVVTLEQNIQNVPGNVDGIIGAQVAAQSKPLTEQVEKVHEEVKDVMARAEEMLKNEFAKLVNSDQAIKDAVEHVAQCTEGELLKIQGVAEKELIDMKQKVQDEFDNVKTTVESYAKSTDAGSRIAALEALGASHVQLIEESRQHIQATMNAHGEFISQANHRMENMEQTHGRQCHCGHV